MLKLCVDIINPFNIKKSDVKSDYRLITPSCIKNSKIQSYEYGSLDNHRELRSKYFLVKNDVLFQAKGNKSDSILITENIENLLPSTSYFILRPDLKKIVPKYLQWILKTELAQKYFEKNTSGVTIKVIRKNILEDFNINLPTLEEQKKLAILIDAFEIEKMETEKYLKAKEKLIERKILLKQGAVING
ncbi:MAG: restriction endonuclease subunit S [Fusobacteriaceae bacterium]